MTSASSPSVSKKKNKWLKNFREFIPKSVLCLQEGYTKSHLWNDLTAGFTIGVIALPLAMAFAIASGVTPDRGLYTAIVAGFLISLLGGSRVQIGGPTGAFVVIVYSIVQRHGYEGLAIATLIGGILIALMGLARLGSLLKFIPYPVVVGFTSGIAVVIFSSQMKDFFGLKIGAVPAEFLEKWHLFLTNIHTWNPWAFVIATGSLATIFTLRHYFPRIPGVILAVIGATVLASFFGLPVETIGTKFGSIPRTLPSPSFPSLSLEKVLEVFPDAVTIALLGAIESLLSAVVADGMIGTRHRSNSELLAQGIANIGSVIFGGIPATGAIARTTANVKMHAKTPIAGMFHALTLLLLMLLLSPLASMIPLSALAAVLVYVAWNMSEIPQFLDILKGQKGDAILLVTTFVLTVLIDLTVAVQVGIILAALIFLKRMSTTTQGTVVENHNGLPEVPDQKLEEVFVFEIEGPLFFGAVDILNEAFRFTDPTTKLFILHMHHVPMIDSSGVYALKQLQKRCEQRGITLVVKGVRSNLQHFLEKAGVAVESDPLANL